jgi:hypothetical protein
VDSVRAKLTSSHFPVLKLPVTSKGDRRKGLVVLVMDANEKIK